MNKTLTLLVAAIVATVSVVTNEPPVFQEHVQAAVKPSKTVKKVDKPVTQPEPAKAPEPVPVPPTPAPVPEPTPAPVAAPTDAESVAWNYFIGQGYSRIHTAAIIGNLMQEHGLQTNDVPGGLGIAQWLGGRRAGLIAKGNYLDLGVQLAYIHEELNTTESRAGIHLQTTTTVEAATLSFQNMYERCNPVYCNYARRLQFAQAVLTRH